jgi:membrane protease YdiL (CAAX protease family)/cytochrome c-type biogenesis protein CcmH/NrfG
MKKIIFCLTVLIFCFAVNGDIVQAVGTAPEDDYELTWLRDQYKQSAEHNDKMIKYSLWEDAVVRLYVDKKYEQAEKELERLLEERPGNWGAFQFMIETFLAQKKYDNAIELCRKYLLKDPDNIYLHLTLCRIYSDRGQTEMIKKHARKIFSIDKDNYDASLYMGIALYAEGKDLQSVYYFSKAQNLNPEQLSSYIKLGKIYLEGGQVESALEQIEKGIRINHKNEKLLSLAARAYEQAGDLKKSRIALEEALKINPENDQLNMKLAGYYVLEEKYKKAGSLLEKVSDSEEYVFEKNIMLAFVYGALSQASQMNALLMNNPKVFLAMVGSIFLLFCVSLGLIAALFFTAFWIGKKTRHRSVRYKNIQWSLPQAFNVCVVLYSLPLLLEIIFGGIFFNNWLMFLSPSKFIEAEAGQNSLLAQMATVFLTGGLVFWLVIKENKQSLRDLGFRWVGLKKIFFIVLKSVGAIFLFNACYLGLFAALSGQLPEQQYIGEIISNAKQMNQVAFLFFMAVIVGPFAEEIIFRGFIYSGLRRHADFRTASIISACIFSLFHMHAGLFIPLAFMGYIFARIFEKTRSILPSVIVHMLWNFLSFSSLIFS